MYMRFLLTMIILFGLEGCFRSCIMAETTGATSPGTMASVERSPSGVAWLKPSQAKTSDNLFASSIVEPSIPSDWLVATDFSFSIPDDAMISGIKASIELKTGTLSHRFGNAYLVINGQIDFSTDQADGETFNITESTITFGSSTNLWGIGIAPSIINSSGFGFAIGFPEVGDNFISVQVDHMQIEVFYKLLGSSQLFSAGAVASELFAAGAQESQGFTAGAQAAENYAAGAIEAQGFAAGSIAHQDFHGG